MTELEPKWIAQDVIIAMHDRQVAEFGGAAGVRDLGLLQSAIARPQNAFYYNQVVSLTKLAACYAFGIAKNLVFVNGNKRTAFMACYLFLLKNGFVIKASDEERFITILSLANGNISEEEFASWLENHTVKTS